MSWRDDDSRFVLSYRYESGYRGMHPAWYYLDKSCFIISYIYIISLIYQWYIRQKVPVVYLHEQSCSGLETYISLSMAACNLSLENPTRPEGWRSIES